MFSMLGKYFDRRKRFIKFLILANFVYISQAQAPNLECWICSGNADDLSCVEEPSSDTATAVECEGGWCTVIRQELVDTPGQVVSFTRGCSRVRPRIVDGTERDPFHFFYYRSCRTPLCNTGNGIRSLGQSGSGGIDALIIVEEDSGGNIPKYHSILTILPTFLPFLIFRLIN